MQQQKPTLLQLRLENNPTLALKILQMRSSLRISTAINKDTITKTHLKIAPINSEGFTSTFALCNAFLHPSFSNNLLNFTDFNISVITFPIPTEIK